MATLKKSLFGACLLLLPLQDALAQREQFLREKRAIPPHLFSLDDESPYDDLIGNVNLMDPADEYYDVDDGIDIGGGGPPKSIRDVLERVEDEDSAFIFAPKRRRGSSSPLRRPNAKPPQFRDGPGPPKLRGGPGPPPRGRAPRGGGGPPSHMRRNHNDGGDPPIYPGLGGPPPRGPRPLGTPPLQGTNGGIINGGIINGGGGVNSGVIEGADAPFYNLEEPQVIYAPDILDDLPTLQRSRPKKSRSRGRKRGQPGERERERGRPQFSGGPAEGRDLRGGGGPRREKDGGRKRRPGVRGGNRPPFLVESHLGREIDEEGIILDEPLFEIRPQQQQHRPGRPGRRPPSGDDENAGFRRPGPRGQGPPRGQGQRGRKRKRRPNGASGNPLSDVNAFFNAEDTVEYIDDADYDVNYDVAGVELHDHQIGMEIEPYQPRKKRRRRPSSGGGGRHRPSRPLHRPVPYPIGNVHNHYEDAEILIEDHDEDGVDFRNLDPVPLAYDDDDGEVVDPDKAFPIYEYFSDESDPYSFGMSQRKEVWAKPPAETKPTNKAQKQ